MQKSDDTDNKAPSLSEQACTRIKNAILNGELQPGAPLPFQKLQSMCSMSVSPVREALVSLVAKGLVEVEHNRGYRVARLTVEELRDITQFRARVEGWALELSMQLGDDAWEGRVLSAAHRLNRLQRESPWSQERLDAWEARHVEFHQALISACASPILLQTCDQLYDRTDRYRRIAHTLEKDDRDVESEHQALTDAVLERDVPRAQLLLSNHYGATVALVERYLESIEDA